MAQIPPGATSPSASSETKVRRRSRRGGACSLFAPVGQRPADRLPTEPCRPPSHAGPGDGHASRPSVCRAWVTPPAHRLLPHRATRQRGQSLLARLRCTSAYRPTLALAYSLICTALTGPTACTMKVEDHCNRRLTCSVRAEGWLRNGGPVQVALGRVTVGGRVRGGSR